MVKIQTGNIYRLIGTTRLCVVESLIILDNNKFAVIYPLSTAVYMASDLDFIILDEPCFNNISIMAESWNSLALPVECLDNLVGKLSSKCKQYFSSFVYFKYQSAKNKTLRVLTGPPIKSNTDIRYLFRAQELEDISAIRDQLISTVSLSE